MSTDKQNEMDEVRAQLAELEGLYAICLADEDFPGVEVNHKFYRAFLLLHHLESMLKAHKQSWNKRADEAARLLGY